MIVTISLLDKEQLYCDSLEAFSVSLDEQNQKVLVYHRDELIGEFANVCGISLDDFIAQVKYKAL